MIEVKIMVVPGRIAIVSLPDKATVIDAAKAAAQQIPNVRWVEMIEAKGGAEREVRVQNRKYSNTNEVPKGYFGSVYETPLNDGEIILILTKIQGNDKGVAVLTCIINDVPYALETPVEVSKVLTEAARFNLAEVKSITINGAVALPDQLVGDNDKIEVEFDKAKQKPKKAKAALAKKVDKKK